MTQFTDWLIIFVRYNFLSAFTEDVKGGPGALVIGLGLFCLIALMLPTNGDQNTSIPPYLHLTFNQKLIAAYILGTSLERFSKCLI